MLDRPARLTAATTLLALATLAAPAEAQRRCTKGIPCGNSCIAATKTCRIGTPASTPAQSPSARERTAQQRKDSIAAAERARATRPAAAAAGGAATKPATDPSAPADTAAPTFVGDASRKIFFKRGCAAAARVKEDDRVVFSTEVEAKAAGYARSGAEGC